MCVASLGGGPVTLGTSSKPRTSWVTRRQWFRDLSGDSPTTPQHPKEIEDAWALAPGSLISQSLVRDTWPDLWDRCGTTVFNIHMIDAEQYAEATGKKRIEAVSNIPAPTSSTLKSVHQLDTAAWEIRSLKGPRCPFTCMRHDPFPRPLS